MSAKTARDLMRTEIQSVSPYMPLPDLERLFIEEKVGGFPVVSDGRLVGIISRSDVIRQLCVEQSLSESISDYYREFATEINMDDDLEAIATRVGRRIEQLRVQDLMMTGLLTVPPDAAVDEVARLLVDHHVHRVLVTDDGQLLGIISSLDLVKLLAGETHGP